MSNQLTIFDEMNDSVKAPPSVPFVNEVEIFNATFGKPNNYEPTIPEKKEWQFVYDFILEELEEYRQACENGDICLNLVLLKKRPYRLSPFELKNRVSLAIMKRLMVGISYTDQETEK